MRVNANTGGLRVGLEGQGLRAKQVTCRQQQAGYVAHDTPDEQVWLTHPESENPEGRKVSPWQTERRHEDHTLKASVCLSPMGKSFTSPPHSPTAYLLLFYKLAYLISHSRAAEKGKRDEQGQVPKSPQGMINESWIRPGALHTLSVKG